MTLSRRDFLASTAGLAGLLIEIPQIPLGSSKKISDYDPVMEFIAYHKNQVENKNDRYRNILLNGSGETKSTLVRLFQEAEEEYNKRGYNSKFKYRDYSLDIHIALFYDAAEEFKKRGKYI
ncbi:hypothetical protein HYX19_05100 [Candidatus Woesearchaeota archaeon]|nr:hypothetical protein [Candidatus Woesearchaeota archaeon]